MEKIHYSTLEDFKKYNKEIAIETLQNLEEAEARKIIKEWYAVNLPIDLLSWCRVNKPSETMNYEKGYWSQIMLIRDSINMILNDYRDVPVMVISTHTSKSIELPVYEINIKNHGIKIILRDNFHDWKLSIISEKDISIDFLNLFDEEEVINPIYCEGFKDNQVFSSYSKNKSQFTLEIRDDFRLYTFMHILIENLKTKRD